MRLIRYLLLFKRGEKKSMRRCLMENLSSLSRIENVLFIYSGSWGQLQNFASRQTSLSKKGSSSPCPAPWSWVAWSCPISLNKYILCTELGIRNKKQGLCQFPNPGWSKRSSNIKISVLENKISYKPVSQYSSPLAFISSLSRQCFVLFLSVFFCLFLKISSSLYLPPHTPSSLPPTSLPFLAVLSSTHIMSVYYIRARRGKGKQLYSFMKSSIEECSPCVLPLSLDGWSRMKHLLAFNWQRVECMAKTTEWAWCSWPLRFQCYEGWGYSEGGNKSLFSLRHCVQTLCPFYII